MDLDYAGKQKVTFDLGGVLTWDYFEPHQIDQIKADPVGTGVGLLHRQAAAFARGEQQDSYDGISLSPFAVDDIAIELPHPPHANRYLKEYYTFVEAREMRAHLEAGSTSAGAYGELTPDQIALTQKTFARVFAPETIIIPRTPAPITVSRATFANAVEGPHEQPIAQSAPVRDMRPLPEEPPYDGIISSGPVS